jgi:flagellin-like protein
MRTMITSSSRKAFSTILGTLIFIAILFSAVMPMYLTMNQADIILENAKLEKMRAEADGSSESMNICAYPESTNSTQIYLSVENTGQVGVSFIRVWVGENSYDISDSLAVGGKCVIGPYTLQPVEGTSYSTSLITGRGNKFTSYAGSLQYQDGGWVTPTLGIIVNIINDMGMFKIYYTDGTTEILSYESQGVDKGDVSHIITIDQPGSYQVTVKVKTGGSYVSLPGSPVDVAITWPGGSPIVNIIVLNR